jgi:thioesterase domain-containing protein
MGGLIALAMTRELVAAGAKVDETMLIDTDLPDPGRGLPMRARHLVEAVRDLGRILRWRVWRGLGPGRQECWLPAYRKFVGSLNARARRRHRPARHDGNLRLLVAADGSPAPDDPRLRLGDIAPGATVHPVPGLRARLLLPPAVDSLAFEMRRLLKYADARHPG